MPAVAAPCLLARSQPHRRSLLQGEEPHQEGEGEDAGSAIRGHRSGAGGDQQGGCPWLLRGLRLRGVSGPLIMKIALEEPKVTNSLEERDETHRNTRPLSTSELSDAVKPFSRDSQKGAREGVLAASFPLGAPSSLAPVCSTHQPA